MSRDPLEVVKVYSGPLVLVETYHAALAEAGITSEVVGTELTGGIGSALPAAVELWVHRADLSRVEAIINREGGSGGKSAHHRPRQTFPHPTDSPKPPPAPRRKEPYVNPDPGA